MEYDDEFDEDLPDIEDYPTLISVVRFNKLIPSIPWFSEVGEPLDQDSVTAARDYMDGLGFPGAFVAEVENWEDAAYAAANPEFNSEWWDAEEQLRMALTTSAGIEDQELIRATAGSALQSCHQAALVLAAGEEDTHPFALKYRLFEHGHWPIAITGSSFNIF